VAEETQQECKVAIRQAKPPKRNIRKDEAVALNNLRNNVEIKILKADKGNATVIMNTKDRFKKMHEHLACGT